MKFMRKQIQCLMKGKFFPVNFLENIYKLKNFISLHGKEEEK